MTEFIFDMNLMQCVIVMVTEKSVVPKYTMDMVWLNGDAGMNVVDADILDMNAKLVRRKWRWESKATINLIGGDGIGS